MSNDPEQRFEERRVRRAAEPLTGKPDQRGAVTVVGLEASSAKLRPRRLCFRGRQQPHTTGKAPLELGRPCTMQRPRRLDRDQRLPRGTARSDQPDQLLDAATQRWQPDRLPDQAADTARQPNPVRDLAGIDRDHQRLRRKRLPKQTRHEQPPFEEQRRKTTTLPGREPRSDQLSAYQRRTRSGAPNGRSTSGTSPWKFSRIASTARSVTAVPFSVCTGSTFLPAR